MKLRSGPVRFWLKPLWDSGTGTGDAAKLIEVGSRGDESATNGWWSLFANDIGDTIYFVSQTNNAVDVTNLTASVSFTSNRWCQIVLTYTNGAVALYTNGVLCASDTASLPYPPLATRTNGFTMGCATDGAGVVKGVFEDLETFNYPFCADDIQTDFELAQPPMLMPNLQLWLKADAGVQTNTAGKVNPWMDQSGNANDAFQNTDANRPLYSANGLGGKAAVYFPGTNNYFTLPTTLSNGVTELEGFVVLQADSAMPVTSKGLWRMGTQGSQYPSAAGKIADSFASGSSQRTFAPPEISLTEPHVYNAASRSNEWTCRFDGIVHFSQSNNLVRLASPFYLGNGSGNYFAGNIGEVLFFSRVLTAMERFAIESYLCQRFGLVTNPPPVPGPLTVFAVSTNQISLTWSNALSSTNTAFLVQRRTATGCYGTVALVRNGLSYLDRDLAAGIEYSYRIKSISYSGESAVSTETNATTLSSGITIPLASLVLWLKADAGHGPGAVNCWVDQTTNNNSACFRESYASSAPRWSGFNTNGHPVVSFWGTNAYELPGFLASATQAEAFVVVRSFGNPSTNWASLWWMSGQSLNSRYPYANNFIEDNFGRSGSTVKFNSGLANLSTLHLYNPMSRSGLWSGAFNNGARYTNNVNTPSFPPTYSLLGRGANSGPLEFLNGELTELMIFDHELTQWERDVISTNYLNKRFSLW